MEALKISCFALSLVFQTTQFTYSFLKKNIMKKQLSISSFRARRNRWLLRSLVITCLTLFSTLSNSQNHVDLNAAIADGNNTLSDLVYGLQTTAYIREGQLDIVGEGSAQVIDVKAADLVGINLTDSSLDGVSTVIIRIEQAPDVFANYDTSELTELQSLAYVVVLCSVNASASEVAAIPLNGLPTGVQSYFAISIPE
jgi:hypothetical protein